MERVGIDLLEPATVGCTHTCSWPMDCVLAKMKCVQVREVDKISHARDQCRIARMHRQC